jgi:hyperosmotically inducible periplasmic protein
MARFTLSLALASTLVLSTTAFAQGAPDAQLQADVQHQLSKKQFRDIHATVQNGVVTLTGSVNSLSDKLDAEKRIEKTREAQSINDQITVNGPQVSDQELYNKIAKALAFDRQGYPSFPFNAIIMHVRNGVVELAGEVVEPVDKESAVGVVTNTPGVRGLVDHLKVAPVSPNDWAIRRAMYQAVYGSPVSTKYAIDPGKPIRIVVDNGHVTLVGTVQNTGDRQIIYQRASGVPGAFSVTNDLQVAGQGSESAR